MLNNLFQKTLFIESNELVTMRVLSTEEQAMKLNHLDLQVSNVQAARHFFETFFGLRCSHARAELVILEDKAGFVLAVSNLSNVSAS
jgi:catechol-2,3-dioxygenase